MLDLGPRTVVLIHPLDENLDYKCYPPGGIIRRKVAP